MKLTVGLSQKLTPYEKIALVAWLEQQERVQFQVTDDKKQVEIIGWCQEEVGKPCG